MIEKYEWDYCKYIVYVKLKLIEEVDILYDDIVGKFVIVSYKIIIYDFKIYYFF